MRLALAGVLLAAGLSTPAAAERWRGAAEADVQTGKTVMLVDEASLSRTGRNVTGWTMSVVDKPDGQDWNILLMKRAVNCDAMEVQDLHSKFFHDEVRLQDTESIGEWRPVTKGTVLERLAQVMCGEEQYLTGVLDDPVGITRDFFDARRSSGG